MSAPDVLTKVCKTCGETKNLSEFYVQPKNRDGHATRCKICERQRAREYAAKARAEMGDEMWRDLQRRITAKSRAKNSEVARAYSRAQNRALWALANRHRKEFEHLLLLARRGELEAAS